MHVGRHQDVIEHEKPNGQHGRHAQDVEGIRQRDETPFGGGEIEDVTNDDAEQQKVRQHAQQQRQPLPELLAALEAQVERGKKRRRRRACVMQGDQIVAQTKMRQTRHSKDR